MKGEKKKVTHSQENTSQMYKRKKKKISHEFMRNKTQKNCNVFPQGTTRTTKTAFPNHLGFTISENIRVNL